MHTATHKAANDSCIYNIRVGNAPFLTALCFRNDLLDTFFQTFCASVCTEAPKAAKKPLAFTEHHSLLDSVGTKKRNTVVVVDTVRQVLSFKFRLVLDIRAILLHILDVVIVGTLPFHACLDRRDRRSTGNSTDGRRNKPCDSRGLACAIVEVICSLSPLCCIGGGFCRRTNSRADGA